MPDVLIRREETMLECVGVSHAVLYFGLPFSLLWQCPRRNIRERKYPALLDLWPGCISCSTSWTCLVLCFTTT